MTSKVRTRVVGVDVFGNGVPEVASAQVEGTGKSLRIVSNEEFEIRPGKRARRKPVDVEKVARVSVLSRMGGFFNGSGKESTETLRAQQEAHEEIVADLSARFEHAFTELKYEFGEREKQLEDKLQAASHRLSAPVRTKNTSKMQQVKIFSGVVIGGVAVCYLLFVMTSMEGAMSSMSGDITAMNGTIGGMGQDTNTMAKGIVNLDGNMQYMNSNIAQMNGNMAHMNHNVGQMTKAVEPMGQAAANVNPFLGAVRSFFPF